MKKIVSFYFLLISIVIQTVASEPPRDPFIQIFIEGKLIDSGSEYEANKGDQFTLLAQLKGGRSDVVKFPDTYADFDSNAIIISRGNNKLIYEVDGQEKRWELLSESIEFESDDKIKLEIVNELANKHLVEVSIPAGNIEKSYIKVAIISTWQFTDGNTTRLEENKAEAVILLDIIGNQNEWFATPNIKASGYKSDLIEEKLQGIQRSYDKIENLFLSFNFASVQGEIKNLQHLMNELETDMQKTQSEDPTNALDVHFIGSPCDDVIKDIENFKVIARAWNESEEIVAEQQKELIEIEQSNDKYKRKDLLSLIKPLIKWQESLPHNTETLLQTYSKDIDWTQINIFSALSFNPEKERINNLDRATEDFKNFLARRIELIPIEKQKINYASTRLQAVRIFDGMLMGYFSSIKFAKWENTRIE